MYGRLYAYISHMGKVELLTRIGNVGDVSWMELYGVMPAAQPSIEKVLNMADVRLVQLCENTVQDTVTVRRRNHLHHERQFHYC